MDKNSEETEVIEWISGKIVNNPVAIRLAGRVLFSMGGGMVIVGLRADWLLAKLTRRHLAPVNAEGPQTLAEMYPGLWTGWIPETLFGYQVAVFCMLVGFALAQLAQRVLKPR